MTLDPAPLEQRIRALGEWFHNLDINGVQTAPHHPLGDHPRQKWLRFAHMVPDDLRGRTVLDIGCNAGFFSLEMTRRGASRVVAIDSDPRYLAQAQLAANAAGAAIEFHELSVYDVAALRERFDVVLFMGVLYHLRHPLLALDLIHDHVAGDLLVFQTLLRGSPDAISLQRDYPLSARAHFEHRGYPLLHFVEHRYAGDPTNWWIPNRECAKAMLRSSGFSITDTPEDDVFVCRRTERPSLSDL